MHCLHASVVAMLVFAGCASSASTAAPSNDAGVDATGDDAGAREGFSVRPGAVFAGQYGVLAGDPSLIADASAFRLYYTCYATDIGGTETCLATSPDGLAFTHAPTGAGATEGRVLHATKGAWDGAHETPYAVQHGTETWLYFVGYADAAAGFLGSPSASIGLATSTDGVHFVAHAGPVLGPTPNALDDHGMTSPTIVPWNGGWTMIYTGWCVAAARCPRVAQGRYHALMSATSPDGVTWTRRGTNLFDDAQLPSWAPGGIAETHVFEAAPGRWVLLFTALTADAPHAVGLATGPSPEGPWTVRPAPLITAADMSSWADRGAVAPHGRVDGGRLRVWFAGEDSHGPSYRLGYGEGPWPLP